MVRVIMPGMIVTVMLAATDDLVHQVIRYAFERHQGLIMLMRFTLGGAQGFDGRHVTGDFVFAEDDRKCCTAGIGPFHLRLDAATRSRRAM